MSLKIVLWGPRLLSSQGIYYLLWINCRKYVQKKVFNCCLWLNQFVSHLILFYISKIWWIYAFALWTLQSFHWKHLMIVKEIGMALCCPLSMKSPSVLQLTASYIWSTSNQLGRLLVSLILCFILLLCNLEFTKPAQKVHRKHQWWRSINAKL